MLKPPTANEERAIPYITELSGLLHKDAFTELNADESRLEQLKKHFITHFAKLEGLTVNNIDSLKQHSKIEYLKSQSRNLTLWNKIKE